MRTAVLWFDDDTSLWVTVRSRKVKSASVSFQRVRSFRSPRVYSAIQMPLGKKMEGRLKLSSVKKIEILLAQIGQLLYERRIVRAVVHGVDAATPEGNVIEQTKGEGVVELAAVRLS